MIRRPPRSTQSRSSAASDVYKRQELAQALRVAVRLELGQRLGLDLADALARDAELLPDLFEGARVAARAAEAQLDDAALALREQLQHADELLALHDVVDLFDRRGGILVFDEVDQQRVALVADRRVKARWLLADLEDLAHALGR